MSIARALEFLHRSEVFLASGSPRRRELLRKLNIPQLSHLAIPEAVENLDPTKFPGAREYVIANVGNKIAFALDHANDRRYEDQTTTDNYLPDIVIAADTVVVNGKDILEKPKSSADNFRMIEQLVGKEHVVITAVSFILPKTADVDQENKQTQDTEQLRKSAHTLTVETTVRLVEMDAESISAYVNSGEGSDKAGGYAIQGLGAAVTHSIHGCYYNVMGFPINAFVVALGERLSQ